MSNVSLAPRTDEMQLEKSDRVRKKNVEMHIRVLPAESALSVLGTNFWELLAWMVFLPMVPKSGF